MPRLFVLVGLLVALSLSVVTIAAGPPGARAAQSDADSDKVADADDLCPTTAGPSYHGGCPVDENDRDDDGVPNGQDICPDFAGPSGGPSPGCPLYQAPGDGDGDGIPDGSDRCPSEQGPAKFGGCPAKDVPEIGQEPAKPPSPRPANASKLTFDPAGKARRGAPVTLLGTPFGATAPMSPRKLTIWLPKGFKVEPKPLKGCSQQKARQLTLDSRKTCAQLFGGRMSGDVVAWFAFVGTNGKLWIRGRRGDELSGFATGSVAKAGRGFGPKITLDLGGLRATTSVIEILSEPISSPRGRVSPLRMGGACPRSGLKYRVRLETADGTAQRTTEGACG